MGRIHPEKPKRYKSKESYRKFRAYVHIRTPTGKKAKTKRETISGRTPKSHKEKVVYVGGKKHRPKLT